MTTVEGEMLRNKLTQDLFKIKKIEDAKVVMLEDKRDMCVYGFTKRTWVFFLRK